MISVPAGLCNLCREIIYQRDKFDDKTCKCGYIKVETSEFTGNPEFLLTNPRIVCLHKIDALILNCISAEELKEDWKSGKNNYGRILGNWVSRL